MIRYDSSLKVFIAYLTEKKHDVETYSRDSEVARADSQSDIEKKIDKYLKNTKNFPIQVIRLPTNIPTTPNDIVLGRLTSAKDSESDYRGIQVFMMYDEPLRTTWGSQGKSKDSFNYNRYYRKTPENLAIIDQIYAKQQAISDLRTDIKGLIDSMTDKLEKGDLVAVAK
jgi:hypothetical protein